MDRNKFRHEIKHYISLSDYYSIKQRLDKFMKRDKFAGEKGEYTIRSLYFDNIYDKALREKLDGINDREKFRLRCYNNDFSYIKLEKKLKKNGLCNKISTKVTKEECEKIINRDFLWMKNSSDELIGEFYEKIKYQQLRAKTLVDYKRNPYTYPLGNVRVTLDWDIKTGIYSNGFLDENTPMVSFNINKAIILEVKYDEYIPSIIKDLVQVNGRSATAFSKYSACRVFG